MITISDIIIVFTLIILEGLLSVDNAVVLAIMVNHLPQKEQKKALTYGILGAITFRILALIFVIVLLKIRILILLGGLYLLFISLKHFYDKKFKSQSELNIHKKVSIFGLSPLWSAVINVELADMVFSIDSILAARAMSPKAWVIITGGILGIITMRFVAGIFIKLIKKYPLLVDGAYIIVSIISIKLFLEYFHIEIEHIQTFTIVLIVLIFLGSIYFNKKESNDPPPSL